jgi:signal transduction histidine kinase
MDEGKAISLSRAWEKQQIDEKASILNGISDAIMLLDAKTYEILDVNQAFLDLYMVGRDYVRAKTCYQITHNREKPCSLYPDHDICPLEQTVETGNVTKVEHLHKDQEGKNLYFEVNAYPLKDSNGRIDRVIHISRDVTHWRLAEDALKEKVSRSEHLAALGQLVAEISHEIKNPLMMIGGFTRQLFKPVDEETKRKKLTIIAEQVERLEKLLEDLREYYLQKPPAIKPVNINKALKKVLSLVEEECEEKNILISLSLPDQDLIVNWDLDKLDQVLLNVIKNSIESMDKGGNLWIRTGTSKQKVEIIIEDNGPGISKANMDKIFECSFTTKSYGTGLGLCISKKNVNDHDGSDLSIESEEGKGTKTIISLPDQMTPEVEIGNN